MIKIEHPVFPSPEQMDFIIEGMRNPMNSWEKSDSGTCLGSLPCHSCHENRNNCKRNIDAGFIVGENDRDLMYHLVNAGTDHRKFMRMMPVYVRITAPLYWWKEFDTYKVGTVTNSCSTMHKITAKPFSIEDFSREHLVSGWLCEKDGSINVGPLDNLEHTVAVLNRVRETYLKARGDSFTSSSDIKKMWWQLIQLLPSSYNQTRNVMLNYEVLATIYKQRHRHKLDEWVVFCEWMIDIPYSELILMAAGMVQKYIKEKMDAHKLSEDWE